MGARTSEFRVTATFVFHFIYKLVMVREIPPQAFVTNSNYLVLDCVLSVGLWKRKRQNAYFEGALMGVNKSLSQWEEWTLFPLIHIHSSPGTSLPPSTWRFSKSYTRLPSTKPTPPHSVLSDLTTYFIHGKK